MMPFWLMFALLVQYVVLAIACLIRGMYLFALYWSGATILQYAVMRMWR